MKTLSRINSHYQYSTLNKESIAVLKNVRGVNIMIGHVNKLSSNEYQGVSLYGLVVIGAYPQVRKWIEQDWIINNERMKAHYRARTEKLDVSNFVERLAA